MPLKDHLNKIEYFCSIVENKSILKASHQLGITQPQLSRVVKQLEEDLDKKLLVRSSSGVEPTKEGADLYKVSQEVLSDIGLVEKHIKSGGVDLKGMVRIGTYDSIARYFFPSFLKFIEVTAPKLDIYLETSRSSHIFKKVKSGDLEIGIFVDQPGLNSRGVDKQEIYSDSFGFYHHTNTSPHFLEQIILFPEALDLEEGELNKVIKINKFRTRLVSDNLETVKALAEEGVGVGLLPHRVAREAVLQGRLVPFRDSQKAQALAPHKVVLCRNKVESTPATESVVKEIMRFLSSWARN